MRLKRLLWVLPLLIMSVSVSGAAKVIAQATCPDLVQRALLAVNENCDDVERNSACYGYNLVSAGFVEDVPEDFFIAPADRAEVVLLETLGTSAMDVDNDIWGVALMNLQANIPNTIPGQNVKFVLIGDTIIENDVQPDEAHTPVDPLDATTINRMNVRSGASTNFNVIAVVDAGVALPADGISPDGDWLRVVHNGAIGWVSRGLVTGDGLDDLPVLDTNTRLPMQAFYLRTGIGEVQCAEAPQDVLLVQGPDAFTVEMTINGAEIRLSSTMLARVVPGDSEADDVLEITAVSGSVEVEGVTLEAGEKTTLCLADAIDAGLDGEANDRPVNCAPSTPEPLTAEEEQSWCSLAELDPSLLNYPVPVDCEDGFLEREEEPTDPVDSGTLNNSSTQPQPSNPVTTTLDCRGFAPTSPLGQVAAGTSNFYWDAPASADLISRYVLTVNTAAGSQTVDTTTTTATVSNLQLLETITWQVDAYRGDDVVCSTDAVTAQVVGVPPTPTLPSPATAYGANWSCTGSNYEVLIYWNDANPGDGISATVTDDDTATFTGSGFGESGSLTIPVGYSFLTNITIINTATGVVDNFSLPAGTLCKPIPVDVSSFACVGTDNIEIGFSNALPGQPLVGKLVDAGAGTLYTNTITPVAESGSVTVFFTPGINFSELALAIPILSEEGVINFSVPFGPC